MRVLLSEGSSLTARQAVASLGRAGHAVEIIDADPLCLGRFSRHVRRFHRAPSAASEPAGYLDRLLEVLASGRCDVLLPTHEQVLLVAKKRVEIEATGVGVAAAPYESIRTLLDKAATTELFTELDLPQPRTRLLTAIGELRRLREFPVYVKLPTSTASAGVHLISDAADAARLADQLDAHPELLGGGRLLAQEPLEGTFVLIASVFDRGILVSHHCAARRREGDRGASTAKTSVSLPSVHEHLTTVGAHLRWHGALSLDAIIGADGVPRYLDVNPRLVEPANALAAGVDLVSDLIAISTGHPITAGVPGAEGLRTHMLLGALFAAASCRHRRRDVVRELARAMFRTGEYRHSREELVPTARDLLGLVPLTAVLAQLLVLPSSAGRLQAHAVENYALTPRAVELINLL